MFKIIHDGKVKRLKTETGTLKYCTGLENALIYEDEELIINITNKVATKSEKCRRYCLCDNINYYNK
jgi:hypothetical protein